MALSKHWDKTVQLMMGGVSLFYLWASSFGVLSLQYFRGVAVLYSLVVPLLLYRGWKRARGDAPSSARSGIGRSDGRGSSLLDRSSMKDSPTEQGLIPRLISGWA